MAQPPQNRLLSLFPFQNVSPRIANDPALLRFWLRELILYWTRWSAVILLILLLLFFPSRSRPLATMLLLMMTAGNLTLGWLLLRQRLPIRLPRVRVLATAFDWLVACIALVVFSVDLAEVSPASALAVQMMSTIRYRLRGVALSFAGATGLVGFWAGMHLLAFDVLDADRVPELAFGWASALALIALLQGFAILGGTRLRAFEQALIASQIAAGNRDRHGLSDRELELLPFLARRNLATQEDIGRALPVQISGRTVGTHISNISQKLEISGGRWSVVRAARERGLLPLNDSSSAVNDRP
jgi:DNA-binding CsgD family transcriptional regulator